MTKDSKAFLLVVKYTNHRGDTGVRMIIPHNISFGSTQWHSERQWLMEAFDVEKGANRTFALKDMVFFTGWSSVGTTEGGDIDLASFSQKNRKRCEHPSGFNHKLGTWSLSDWMTAIMGELGEAANVASKLNRVRDNIPGNKETADELHTQLGRELADVFIYLDLIFQYLGLDFGTIVKDTFNAKSEQLGCTIRV